MNDRMPLTSRRLLTVVGLVVVWCALWGSVSAANVLSGTGLALVVLGLGLGTPGRGSVRFVPLLKFTMLVVGDLVRSTASVVFEVLTPTDHTDESIVRVDLVPEGRRHLLLLVVAVTVTPGTAVVDTDLDNGTLYLHLLHHDRRDDTVRHVERLAQLACEALPGGDLAADVAGAEEVTR